MTKVKLLHIPSGVRSLLGAAVEMYEESGYTSMLTFCTNSENLMYMLYIRYIRYGIMHHMA